MMGPDKLGGFKNRISKHGNLLAVCLSVVHSSAVPGPLELCIPVALRESHNSLGCVECAAGLQ